MAKSTFLLGLAGILAATAIGQPPPTPSAEAGYPAAWDVEIPAGTKLAEIKSRYEQTARMAVMARLTDRDDVAPLPPWFRAYLRDQIPDLPLAGGYQYPRVAVQIFEWMRAHPNLETPPPGDVRAVGRAAARWVVVGTNINLTNFAERNSESAIAVDPNNANILIAGSNNISGSGRQKQFWSTDGGSTWSKTELPLASGTAFQSDPSVAFTTDGTAFAATLGINAAGSSIKAELFRSADHGATWSFLSTVSSGNNNDKEMLWIDNDAGSPYRNNLYMVWDVPGGGMRFSRSTDSGVTWSTPASLSADSAIGSHVTTGPGGEVYVAWPDTASRQIRIRRSTDGGLTFDPVRTITTTNDSYEISIPAMCSRNVLIYVTLGVDRSTGPRRGTLYAMWGDREGSPDPGCAGTASAANANVYVARSTDGGSTWSAPVLSHSNPAKTDQFNQWIAVDPTNGILHAAWYDTRDDPGRKATNIYYAHSTDGGATWVDEKRVTSAPTDETAAPADLGNQYGDYNGLAVYQGSAHPVWTDRRTGSPGDREQIYTAGLSSLSVIPICLRHPKLCTLPIDMKPGILVLECKLKPCLVVDPLPKNCLVKFDCPGCTPGGLCPPIYQIDLNWGDPANAVWEVSLYRADGSLANVKKKVTEKGMSLIFTPKKSLYREGGIGDYFLGFKLKETGKTDNNYEIGVSLEVFSKKPTN
jgi:hypothetical protein